jgi:hypothetical protein
VILCFEHERKKGKKRKREKDKEEEAKDRDIGQIRASKFVPSGVS